MAAVLLGGMVKAVADDPPGACPVSQDVLSGRQVAQVRDGGLDHEAAARGEVLGDVAEAGDLRVLRGEVVDRVVHQVGHRENVVHPDRGHVADGHADSVPAWLATEPGHHRPGQFDAVHRHAALGQRQPDAAGADGQFQCPPAARQLREQADRRVDSLWLEHAVGRVVVARGNRLAEVSVWIIHVLRT